MLGEQCLHNAAKQDGTCHSQRVLTPDRLGDDLVAVPHGFTSASSQICLKQLDLLALIARFRLASLPSGPPTDPQSPGVSSPSGCTF
ncbi:hypothetical protein ACLKA6_017730 [Drosophila palustris]